MSNFLINNQKQELRLQVGDITLFEPTDLQLQELKEMLLKEDVNIEGRSEISYNPIRYIIRNCCKDGAFIDEYTDLEIESFMNNGNKNLRALRRECISIIEEVGEMIQEDSIMQLKYFNEMINVFNFNGDVEKTKKKFDKFSKKYKLNITFDELLKKETEKEKLIQELINNK